jgi:hypothetical protein
MPEGVTTVDEPEPVRVTRPAALLSACAPIFLRSIYIEQEEGREKKVPDQDQRNLKEREVVTYQPSRGMH